MALKEAINIPSRDIYQPIENQKVIDNQIDRIEVQSKEVVPDNHYGESIYSENFPLNEKTETFEKQHSTPFTALQAGGGSMRYGISIAGVHCNAKYHNIPQLLIPKVFNNHKITKIDLTEDGFADIKYDVRFDAFYYLHGTSYKPSTGKIDFEQTQQEGSLIKEKKDLLNFNDSSIDYEQDAKEISDWLSSSITAKVSVFAKNSISYNEENKSLQLKADFRADSNGNFVPDPTEEIVVYIPIFSCDKDIEQDEKYYKINNIKILAGIEAIINSNISDFEKPASQITGVLPIEGMRIKTVLKGYIGISLFGNTIGIDLVEKRMFIGYGKQVYDYDGNELIQSTNFPKITDKYNSIIDLWGNGKEISTFKCAIDNYYTDKDVVSEITVNIQGAIGKDILVQSETPLNVGDILVYNNIKLEVLDILAGIDYLCSTPTLEIAGAGIENVLLYQKRMIISKEGKNNLPMIFSIGDIVVPYLFGANEQEKPISIDTAGNPKKFEVKGVKMIYDGAIWQELSLREFKNNATIYVDSVQDEQQDAYLKFHVVAGELKEGDEISYRGEKSFVQQGETSLFLSVAKKGVLYYAVGNTITVEILN